MEPTKCEDCDWLHSSAHEKNSRPEYWLCAAQKRVSYVHGEEPFMRCRGVNGGACRMFKPIKQADPTPDPPPAEPTEDPDDPPPF